MRPNGRHLPSILLSRRSFGDLSALFRYPRRPEWDGGGDQPGQPGLTPTRRFAAMPSPRLAPMLTASALVALLVQPAKVARADVVTDWNVIAINATAVPPNSILQSRVLAIMHIAMHDAAQAIEQRHPPYAVDLKTIKSPNGASVDAAIVTAAHATLSKLAPTQRATLDAALNTALAKIADGKAKAEGVEIGTQVAEKMLALRAQDKSDAQIAYSISSGLGRYQLTPPNLLPAILTQWGRVTPFLKGSMDIAVKGPPALSSPEFAKDFEEIKAIGARDSTTRTADQTAAAIFWTVQTAVPWNAAARALAIAKGGSVSDNARLFAILAAASADSQIACFDAKYRHNFWRPVTAIRNAAELNNPALKADPNWEPLLVTPPQPDYPSAHACLSGAAEAVLRTYFASDDVKVSVTFPLPFGVTRTYTRLSQMGQEVIDARVWGGIHFRTADVDGHALGFKIGEIATRDVAKSASR